jgi:hypothetical protein
MPSLRLVLSETLHRSYRSGFLTPLPQRDIGTRATFSAAVTGRNARSCLARVLCIALEATQSPDRRLPRGT